MRESHGHIPIHDPEMSLLNIRFWVRSPKYSLPGNIVAAESCSGMAY
jgi:hypothetical protein